jgi:hypothetical protein
VNQPNPINVSQARADEIYRGKAAATINDLMVENARLTAIIEAIQEQLGTRELELRKAKSQISELATANTDPSSPGSPQDQRDV